MSLCSKNRFGENGSVFKVNDGGGPYEKYRNRFPEGVQKKEIQQRRQARSRPGEKESLNMMLIEFCTSILASLGLPGPPLGPKIISRRNTIGPMRRH